MTDLHKAARYAREVLDYVDRFLIMNKVIREELVKDAIADLDKALAQPEQELGAYDVPTCKTHPDAPHGFDRFSSHNQDRYVCLCEGWSPCDMGVLCLDCRPRNADGNCPDASLRKNNDKR